MDRQKYDMNKDWEITIPWRLLQVFIFLLISAFLIQNPRHVTDFIPVTLLDSLQMLGLFGLYAFFVFTACQRIKTKQTAGAFLVVDYAIIGSGVLFFSVMVTLLLVRLAATNTN
jgi:hypothetical protein